MPGIYQTVAAIPTRDSTIKGVRLFLISLAAQTAPIDVDRARFVDPPMTIIVPTASAPPAVTFTVEDFETKAGWSEDDRQAATALWKRDLERWVLCLDAASRKYVRMAEQPDYIATAVLESCAELEQASERSLRISARGLMDPIAREELAKRRTEEMRARWRDVVIQRTLDFRLKQIPTAPKPNR